MAEEASLEGFICPYCMENKGSAVGLQQHYEEFHSQKRSLTTLFRDRDSSFKRLIGKAKYKFTSSSSHSPSRGSSLDYSSEEGSKYTVDASAFNPSGINTQFWEEQHIGQSKSFFQEFRSLRDKHVDKLTVETNKVLIRLEKITRVKTSTVCSPSDKKMRKLEMDIVPWQSDKDGKICAMCFKKLIIASKHHCRLCGMVICKECSRFLPMPIALLLERTSKHVLDEAETRKALRIAKEKANELIQNGNLDNALRICTRCNDVIEKRMARIDSAHSRSRLILLYHTMRDVMNQVDALFPKYETMVSGLLEGKIELSREEAKQLRFSILQLTESIDIKSKKVMALVQKPVSVSGTDTETAEISPRQMRLHKGVRSFAVKYLQERITCLPNVPSDSEVLRARREREEEHRVLTRRKTELLPDTRGNSPHKPRSQSHLLSTGWVASPPIAPLVEADEDPYRTQLRILRGFLSQAEAEGREDEIQTLRREVELLMVEIERRDGSSSLNHV